MVSHCATLHFLVGREGEHFSLQPFGCCNLLDPSPSPEKMKWAVAFKAPFQGTLGHEPCDGTVAELEARTSSSEVCISPWQFVCLVLGGAQDKAETVCHT